MPEVRVIRRNPEPPPIDKIVVELSYFDARDFVLAVRDIWNFRAENTSFYNYEKSGQVPPKLARKIEEALNS